VGVMKVMSKEQQNSFFLDGYGNKVKSIVKSFNFKPKEIYYKPSIRKDSLIKITVSKFPPSEK
tara:strand:- start:328 stop:516 length:189 start_codon:yes stop_codon:yes gene_type:complete